MWNNKNNNNEQYEGQTEAVDTKPPSHPPVVWADIRAALMEQTMKNTQPEVDTTQRKHLHFPITHG